MKWAILILSFLVIFIALPILAATAATVFESKEYLYGEAGVVGPIYTGERELTTVTVPMAIFDGNYWKYFTEEKDTNLSGPLPDFEKDYVIGEGGLVNPIERPMEK